jgi:hypothetical protein
MRTPALAVVLAVQTCQPAAVDGTKCPDPALQTAELHAVTRSATASVQLLAAAFDDLGVDPASFRKLNAKAEETYSPWDDGDTEGAVSNPLYEDGGLSGENPLFEGEALVAAPQSDLGTMGGADPETFAAQRDLAAADQGDPTWTAPGVQAGLQVARIDLGATRCVLATLAAGSDERLDACTAAADLLATAALLEGVRATADLLVAEQDARHDDLLPVRDAAQAYLDAVTGVLKEGEAVDAAQDLLDAVDAALADLDTSTSGIGNLPAVLARTVPELDTALDDVRGALRDATLHAAAHEAAHVVQQRGAALETTWSEDGGDGACAGEDLGCLMSSFRDGIVHRDLAARNLLVGAQRAFQLAADKEPIPERKAALKDALQAAIAAADAAAPDRASAERQLQTLSNASKTRHETAKNSVGNIR